ncbi:TonB-dependent siderophore receptor [Pseudomonas sp. PA1(2017)]|uniref:TonB-dependent receptor n=1 Tax=Pseudomonas sp. PA1(2017) TaxID=1932113 RepID=UPI00095C80E5|nr:TonB-dependent receptor [Pseudomonas sp. PA1(2017)]OLU20708.1 TonB-dependent siderophore receptor [Pseudomonas sp. PA1(2017)]
MSIPRTPNKTTLTSLWLPVCLAASFSSAAVYAQTSLDTSPQEAQSAEVDDAAGASLELEETAISASADASREGLVPEFEGGQVARGGRVGILGNKDYMDTPFTSTNYTSQLIEDQQARSVADVLQNDPSVRIARGFGNFQELYVVRGFPLYSDDISYNGLYGLLPRQYVASEFIERVEVFRGASAFLNGAAPGGTGIGGTVNILPKRAPNEPLTRLTVGADSGGQGTVGADIARRFGPENRFGVRLNASKRDGETGVKDEDQTLDMFALGVDYQGDRLRLSADIGHQYHFLDNPRPSVTPNGGIPSAPDAKDNFAQPWTYSKEKQTFGTFRAEYDFADSLTGWLAAGVRDGEEKNRLANPNATPDGATSITPFENYREDSVFTGEAGLRANLQTGTVSHELVTSVAVFDSQEKNANKFYSTFSGNLYDPIDVPQPTTITYDGGDLSDPHVTERTHTKSLALADTLGFLDDRLLVTLGARWQGIETKSYSSQTGDRSGQFDDHEITPVAGVVYKLTDELSAYANYIEGLTKGDAAPATSGGLPVLNAGTSLAPYVAKQTEVGLKYDGGALGGSIAVFQTERPFGLVENQVFREGGEQRNRGIELSAFGEPVLGIRVLGGVTLLNAEQTKTLNGVNDGNDAIGVPKVQANLGGEWDVPGVAGLTLTSLVVHTGKQYASADNDLRLPSWTRLDLGARYKLKLDERDVTLRARLDNATGRDYWASAGGFPNSNYMVLGAPRTLSVSATVDF